MKILKTFVREFSGDTETPITLFYKYVGNEKGFLLESRGEGKQITHLWVNTLWLF